MTATNWPNQTESLPRFAREQMTPPTIVVRDERPKLSVEPTVVGPPVFER